MQPGDTQYCSGSSRFIDERPITCFPTGASTIELSLAGIPAGLYMYEIEGEDFSCCLRFVVK